MGQDKGADGAFDNRASLGRQESIHHAGQFLAVRGIELPLYGGFADSVSLTSA